MLNGTLTVYCMYYSATGQITHHPIESLSELCNDLASSWGWITNIPPPKAQAVHLVTSEPSRASLISLVGVVGCPSHVHLLQLTQLGYCIKYYTFLRKPWRERGGKTLLKLFDFTIQCGWTPVESYMVLSIMVGQGLSTCPWFMEVMYTHEIELQYWCCRHQSICLLVMFIFSRIAHHVLAGTVWKQNRSLQLPHIHT